MSRFFPTVGLGRNAGDLICTCQHIHFGHYSFSIQNWYWPSFHFLFLDHIIKYGCSCRSGCFQVWWYLLFLFLLFSMYWCNRRVSLQRKRQHIRVLPFLLTVLSGKGWVILKGRLLVMTLVASRLDLHLRIPWRSIPTRTTMTHLGLFLGHLLKLPWRPEICIQWYLLLSPQPVSFLVPVKIRLVWRLVWRQPRLVVFANGWIRPKRHLFEEQFIAGTYTIYPKRKYAWIWFRPCLCWLGHWLQSRA